MKRFLFNFVQRSSYTTLPRLLHRDYIHSSLYHPHLGYFSSKQHPILEHTTPLNLESLKSQTDYQKTVAATHTANGHGWMTPIELFSPHLSHAIARRISDCHIFADKIHVIEIGAGRATLCHDCLNYWKLNNPNLLDKLHYHIVEISPELSNFQTNKLSQWIHDGVVSIHNENALLWFQQLDQQKQIQSKSENVQYHVIATEVLDNLPHDLIRITDDGIQQAVVVGLEPGEIHQINEKVIEWEDQIDEQTRLATDAFYLTSPSPDSIFPNYDLSLVNRVRNQIDSFMNPSGREIWVPTTCYQLLQAIITALPNTSLTIADFDFLPGALSGENGPVVQRIEQGSAVVFDSVYAAPFGKVDIMFPTNFEKLLQAHEILTNQFGVSVSGEQKRIVSQHEFFEEYATKQDITATTCQSGYNPVLSDFENASLFLVDCYS